VIEEGKEKYGSSLTNLNLAKSEMSMGINDRLGTNLIASPGNKKVYSLSVRNRPAFSIPFVSNNMRYLDAVMKYVKGIITLKAVIFTLLHNMFR
jgi:hypothetical protein